MSKVLRTKKDVDDAGKILLSKAKKDYQRTSKPAEAEKKEEKPSRNSMSVKVLVGILLTDPLVSVLFFLLKF